MVPHLLFGLSENKPSFPPAYGQSSIATEQRSASCEERRNQLGLDVKSIALPANVQF